MLSAREFFEESRKPIYGYRLDDSIFQACADANADVDVSDLHNVIYSHYSLAECMKHLDHAVYFTEALIKTYPTDKFTQLVAKHVFDALQSRGLLVGQTLEGNYFTVGNDNKMQVFQTLEEVPFGYDFMRMHYSQVEGNVAGKVTYEILTVASHYKSLEEFKQLMQSKLAKMIADAKRCGYSFVAKLAYVDKKTFRYEMHFEANYPEKHISMPDIVWHITSRGNAEKILKKGLKPASKSAINGMKVDHPERVYLFAKSDASLFRAFAQQRGIEDPVAVEIDMSKASLKTLYADPMYEVADDGQPIAIYTYEPISRTAVVEVKDL